MDPGTMFAAAINLIQLIPTLKEVSTIVDDLKNARLDQAAKQAVKEMSDEITKSSEQIVSVTTPFVSLLTSDKDFVTKFLDRYQNFITAKANNQYTVRTHCELVSKHLTRLVGYDEQKDRDTSISDKITNFADKFRLNKEAVRRLQDLGKKFEHADNALKNQMEDYLYNTETILTSIRDDIDKSNKDESEKDEYDYSAKKKFDEYSSTVMPNLNELSRLISDVKISLGSL